MKIEGTSWGDLITPTSWPFEHSTSRADPIHSYGGWDWLNGDWVAAHAVSEAWTKELRVRGHKPVLALFDGEPVRLDPRAPIRAGRSLETFIATRADAVPAT